MQTGVFFPQSWFMGSILESLYLLPMLLMSQIQKLQIPLSSNCFFLCDSVFLCVSPQWNRSKPKGIQLPRKLSFSATGSGVVCFQPKGSKKLSVFASLLLSCHTMLSQGTSPSGSYRRNVIIEYSCEESRSGNKLSCQFLENEESIWTHMPTSINERLFPHLTSHTSFFWWHYTMVSRIFLTAI